MDIKPWAEVVRLHPDVESENTSIATYALDLGALVSSDPSVPLTYRNAYAFFKSTHLTNNMLMLIKDVYDRLSGKEGDRVLQLRSPFGGGKSHTLATLYYAVKNRADLEQAFPETRSLPSITDVRTAVFDGEKFDAIHGIEVDGIRVYTMWGFIAQKLGCYELVKANDLKRVAPGGQLVKSMLSQGPTFILLDEVSAYLERAKAELVGDSTLYKQAFQFMETITTEVASSPDACIVYSLLASRREAYGDTEILSTLDHLTSRVDKKEVPIEGDDIFQVLRKRLLAEPPPEDVANAVADQYCTILKRGLHAIAPDAQDHEIDAAVLKQRERFVGAYPFHPAFIDLMKEQWASISDFQRTRGALRFLAVVLRVLYKRESSEWILASGDVPLYDADVRNAFFTEVGEREPFSAVLEKDFIGSNASVKQIDKGFSGPRRPVMHVATSVLMFSFGGVPKTEGRDGELLPPGVTEQELMRATISPDIDSTTIKAALNEIKSKCLYVHYDGVRYAFKTTPNINLMLEEEATGVNDSDIETRVCKILEKETDGKPAVIWPLYSKSIADKEKRFTIAYLKFDFDKEKHLDFARDLLLNYGERLRIYRNALALAIPNATIAKQLESSTRYIIAIERVTDNAKSRNLTPSHLEQLAARSKNERSAKDSALKELYHELWLLQVHNNSLSVEKLDLGMQVLQSKNLHDRLIEFLKIPRKEKIFLDEVTPTKLLSYLHIEDGMATAEIVNSFFSSPALPALEDEDVIRTAICEGVKDGDFGLTIETEVQHIDGTPKVNKDNVYLGVHMAPNDIDLNSGFIIRPNFILTDESEGIGEGATQGVSGGEPGFASSDGLNGAEEKQRLDFTVDLTVNKKQLYNSFNAIGNLADKSREGKIEIKITAKFAEGYDPMWLKNAVIEPLRELQTDQARPAPESLK